MSELVLHLECLAEIPNILRVDVELLPGRSVEEGHEIFRVFFYHDGVNNGTRLATPPQDDRHIPNRWTELAEKHDIDLVLCVAAAQRRGMVDEDEMKRNSKDANNFAGKFRISGLGQLIEAGIQADRMVTFGD